MNESCIVTVLGVLVHNGVLALPAADHYMKIINQVLEDGTQFHEIDDVLEALNG